jgi:hypothetical protein
MDLLFAFIIAGVTFGALAVGAYKLMDVSVRAMMRVLKG